MESNKGPLSAGTSKSYKLNLRTFSFQIFPYITYNMYMLKRSSLKYLKHTLQKA